jgi:hypothetical protein
MSTALELVYEYRHLSGKCHSGAGLEMPEIEALAAIESVFADPAGRHEAAFAGVLRGPRLCDRVRIDEIGPRGVAMSDCPYLEPGATVELLIDDEVALLSYRFKAIVADVVDGDDNNYQAELVFIGTPLLIRRGKKSAESLAAAA